MTFSTIPDTSSGNNMDLHRDASRDGAVPPLAPQPCPRPSHAASGEKAKARAILAAIRMLQVIEQAQRPTTPDERQVLIGFPGFCQLVAPAS